MKTIKFILATVMMMVAFTVQAQTVQVYKDGAVVKEYPASEVKDVQVKQVYYYYAGWELPANEDELKSKGTLIGNFSTAKSGDKLVLSSEWGVTNDTRETGYYVVPEGTAIYDNSLNIDSGYVVSSILNCGGVKYNIYARTNVKNLGGACYLIKL